jgi:hypothetical protein
MNFTMWALLFISILFAVYAGIPGGWQKIENNDENAVESAKFAVNLTFPNFYKKFQITNALKQVFAYAICIYVFKNCKIFTRFVIPYF